MMVKSKVTIRNDFIIRDAEEIQKILERVSKIVRGSYDRRMKEGVSCEAR
jgi:hypothetical protein